MLVGCATIKTDARRIEHYFHGRVAAINPDHVIMFHSNSISSREPAGLALFRLGTYLSYSNKNVGNI